MHLTISKVYASHVTVERQQPRMGDGEQTRGGVIFHRPKERDRAGNDSRTAAEWSKKMAGAKPKPTIIKKLAGNPGKRPFNQNEPKPGRASPRMPHGVLPKHGQKLWHALAPKLIELGILTEVDLPAFEMLCLHYAFARMAMEDVEINGLTITEDGKTKKNPAMQAFRENSTAYKQLLVEFGLTPSSRSRIVADVLDDEPTLSEILFDGIGD